MKNQTFFKKTLIFILLINSINSVSSQTCIPYLGQSPPGMTPEIFASGIV
jgi:hypothetical protein